LKKSYPACPEDINDKPYPKDASNRKTENAQKRHAPEKGFHICLNYHSRSDYHGRDNKTER
jgi:hypothetical protein